MPIVPTGPAVRGRERACSVLRRRARPWRVAIASRASMSRAPVRRDERLITARFAGDRGGRRAGVEREPFRIDVREHRPRPGHHDGERRECRGQRRRDHFVAWARFRAPSIRARGIGAVSDADGVGGEKPQAPANSASNAATSGPEHEQPLAMPTVDRRRMAPRLPGPASCREWGPRHRDPRRRRSLRVAVRNAGVERDERRQAVVKGHRWRPPGRMREFRGSRHSNCRCRSPSFRVRQSTYSTRPDPAIAGHRRVRSRKLIG